MSELPVHPEPEWLRAERQEKKRIVLMYVAVAIFGICLVCGLAFTVRDQVNLLAMMSERDKHQFRLDPVWPRAYAEQSENTMAVTGFSQADPAQTPVNQTNTNQAQPEQTQSEQAKPLGGETLPAPMSEVGLQGKVVQEQNKGDFGTLNLNHTINSERLSSQEGKRERLSGTAASMATVSSGSQNRGLGARQLMLTKPRLPAGFHPQWTSNSLDQGKITLDVLKQGFTLASTQAGSGLEYYYYSTYLYWQAAQQVTDPKLARTIERLALASEEMADRLQRAIRQRYDGLPDEGMGHLAVRANIMFDLGELNEKALRVIDLDTQGHVLNQSHPAVPFQPGAAMQQYEEALADVLSTPRLADYPQLKTMIERQSDVLRALSSHIELRWESVFSCGAKAKLANDPTNCQNEARHMRVYVYQSASQPSLQRAFN